MYVQPVFSCHLRLPESRAAVPGTVAVFLVSSTGGRPLRPAPVLAASPGPACPLLPPPSWEPAASGETPASAPQAAAGASVGPVLCCSSLASPVAASVLDSLSAAETHPTCRRSTWWGRKGASPLTRWPRGAVALPLCCAPHTVGASWLHLLDSETRHWGVSPSDWSAPRGPVTASRAWFSPRPRLCPPRPRLLTVIAFLGNNVFIKMSR